MLVLLAWGPFLEWQAPRPAFNSSFQLPGGRGWGHAPKLSAPVYSAHPFPTTMLGKVIGILHSLSGQGQSSSHSRSLSGQKRSLTLPETNQFNWLQLGSVAEVGRGQQQKQQTHLSLVLLGTQALWADRTQTLSGRVCVQRWLPSHMLCLQRGLAISLAPLVGSGLAL